MFGSAGSLDQGFYRGDRILQSPNPQDVEDQGCTGLFHIGQNGEKLSTLLKLENTSISTVLWEVLGKTITKQPGMGVAFLNFNVKYLSESMNFEGIINNLMLGFSRETLY